jgi:ribosomal protein L37AE/L43A
MKVCKKAKEALKKQEKRDKDFNEAFFCFENYVCPRCGSTEINCIGLISKECRSCGFSNMQLAEER